MTDTAVASNLLADLGLDEVEENMPDATYPAFLTAVKSVNVTKGKAPGPKVVFEYKIAPGAPWAGEVISEFQSADKANQQGLRYLKRRLASLGVPESQIASTNLNDLVGTAVWVTTKKNGEYLNVNKVEVRDPDAPLDGSVSATPEALGASVPTNPAALEGLI